MLLAVGGLAAPAIAQQAPTNETADNSTELEDDVDSVIYQFDSGAELVDVEFVDGRAIVTLRAVDRPTTVSIAEGEVEGTGTFSYQSVRLRNGEERAVEIPVREEAVVLTSGNEGFRYEGDIGITVLTSTPTTEIVQMAAVSGITGTVLALGIVVGQLRRRHENSYKELFSEQRHRIETDPIEGYYEKAVDSIRRARGSKVAIGTVALVGFYAVGVLTGRVMGPGEAWLAMGDSQRLMVVGSIAATIVAITPVYWLVKKIWNPNREFVLDLDSQDVYRAANGDQSGGVAAYSAPPSRVSELEVDGSPTTIGTPGGRLTLVRGMDPEANTAEANPPELADDREVSIEVQKIDHNRKILTDLATIGRDLIGAMTAFRVTADASSMRDIDAGLRDTVSAGADSLEDVLSDAVAGTRYEGTYQPDRPTIDELEETIDTDEPTSMNDTDDITDDGAQTDE